MDQIKIGKFIAETRRAQGMTQRQLADALNISDKTVSKWECGKGLPEVSLMLPLCELLKISVNDLLSGEKLSEELYHKKAEENMMNLLREKEESRKQIILSAIVALLGVSVLVVCVIVASYESGMRDLTRGILVVFGIAAFLISLGVAIVLDRNAGAFECPKCHTRFVPDMKAYVLGPHTITTRFLKCPACGESSYCKRRLTKNR